MGEFIETLPAEEVYQKYDPASGLYEYAMNKDGTCSVYKKDTSQVQ